MMFNINKSKSKNISILFIDLEVTTEELNVQTVHNVWGGVQGSSVGQLLLTINLFITMSFKNHVNKEF